MWYVTVYHFRLVVLWQVLVSGGGFSFNISSDTLIYLTVLKAVIHHTITVFVYLAEPAASAETLSHHQDLAVHSPAARSLPGQGYCIVILTDV